MDNWESDTYKHFKQPPEIVVEKGVVKYRFQCKVKYVYYKLIPGND